MQLINFSLLALFAAGAFALPAAEAEEPRAVHIARADLDVTARDINDHEGHTLLARARCKNADKPLCNGAQYFYDAGCMCKGQIKPCGVWKCPYDGRNSIVSFDLSNPLSFLPAPGGQSGRWRGGGGESSLSVWRGWSQTGRRR